jgi:hypothetical protein
VSRKYKENYRAFQAAAFLFVFLTSALFVLGQEQQPEACVELGTLNNFFVIDSIRSRLQTEIPQLYARKKEIQEVTLPQVEQTMRDLDETGEKIEALQKGAKSPPDDTQLKDLEKVRSSLKGALHGKTTEILNAELKQIDDDISWKEQQQKCVNTKIQGYSATPEQDFKRTMSVIFSILIGLVIFGFFVMAYLDTTVRRAIFSGQTGLQFVTLFSIVIAIILFGITGILEAKELAALLGGLSGYILGRSSAPRSSPNGGGSLPNPLTGIASVQVTPATATLSSAAPNQQLTATATDAQNNAVSGLPQTAFQWLSDNPAVARVDQMGLVTWVAPGSCNVTATANGLSSAPCAVTCQ